MSKWMGSFFLTAETAESAEKKTRLFLRVLSRNFAGTRSVLCGKKNHTKPIRLATPQKTIKTRAGDEAKWFFSKSLELPGCGERVGAFVFGKRIKRMGPNPSPGLSPNGSTIWGKGNPILSIQAKRQTSPTEPRRRHPTPLLASPQFEEQNWREENPIP